MQGPGSPLRRELGVGGCLSEGAQFVVRHSRVVFELVSREDHAHVCVQVDLTGLRALESGRRTQRQCECVVEIIGEGGGFECGDHNSE